MAPLNLPFLRSFLGRRPDRPVEDALPTTPDAFAPGEGVRNPSGGILGVFSGAELDAIDRLSEERERAAETQPEEVLNLAAHIRSAFEAAVSHRQTSGVTDRLLACQRQRLGNYEPERLAEIARQGGSRIFFNLTETKCSAAEAWIADVLAPVGDRPWALEPTPVPDLPASVKTGIEEEVVAWARGELALTGLPPTGPAIMEVTNRLYDERLRETREEARRRSERMGDKIADQLAEGGFSGAFDGFIRNLCTYPLGILKGPVIRNTRRVTWTGDKVDVAWEAIPTWEAPHPHDFYPGPNLTDLGYSYICERVLFDRALLSEMRELEGWNAGEIDKVLEERDAAQAATTLPGEAERALMETRDATRNSGHPDSMIEGIEYWGSARGADLLEWGMGGELVEDENKFYDVTAVLIGGHVVRAVLNADPVGRRPYYVTSFDLVPNSIWGRSIPERMRDCQDALNGALRNLINNLALASGPMVAVDIDALVAGDDVALAPWRAYQYHGSKVPFSRQPITFFQPDAYVDQLLKVADFFEIKADDRTLIPRYTHGNEMVAGAGETASGLSMLMNAAAKGIKKVIANIDRDILRPMIERIHTWNLVYLGAEYASLKGDVRVVARGTLAMLVREQTQLRRGEFLDRTNNPIDFQIMGLKGRAALLRAIASNLDMPVGDVVPDDETLMTRPAAGQAGGAGAAGAPMELMAGGEGSPAPGGSPPQGTAPMTNPREVSNAA